MKQEFIPHIGLDFEESNGTRTTCFQLCVRRKATPENPVSGLVAVAMVDLNHNGEVERFHCQAALKRREAGIVRLARKYQSRSIPQRFQGKPASARQ